MLIFVQPFVSRRLSPLGGGESTETPGALVD